MCHCGGDSATGGPPGPPASSPPQLSSAPPETPRDARCAQPSDGRRNSDGRTNPAPSTLHRPIPLPAGTPRIALPRAAPGREEKQRREDRPSPWHPPPPDSPPRRDTPHRLLSSAAPTGGEIATRGLPRPPASCPSSPPAPARKTPRRPSPRPSAALGWEEKQRPEDRPGPWHPPPPDSPPRRDTPRRPPPRSPRTGGEATTGGPTKPLASSAARFPSSPGHPAPPSPERSPRTGGESAMKGPTKSLASSIARFPSVMAGDSPHCPLPRAARDGRRNSDGRTGRAPGILHRPTLLRPAGDSAHHPHPERNPRTGGETATGGRARPPASSPPQLCPPPRKPCIGGKAATRGPAEPPPSSAARFPSLSGLPASPSPVQPPDGRRNSAGRITPARGILRRTIPLRPGKPARATSGAKEEGAAEATPYDVPRTQPSTISICRNRSAPTASRIAPRISSGTGESTVSTESARPVASGAATCSPAMLIPASPSF